MTSLGAFLSSWQNKLRQAGARLLHSQTFPYQVFGIGLVIRLLLMPFTAHSDFVHTWWASACMGQQTPTPLHLQSLLFSLHAAYLQLVSPLLPASAEWCGAYYGLAADTASFTDWFSFINLPQIYRILFVLKLPYLLFDLGCAVLLFKIAPAPRQPAWAFKVWWLNPITLYSIYIIGRHESIAIFLILLSLFLIQREKVNWAFLALGIAVAIRYYPLFILPFCLLSLPAAFKEQVKRLGLGLLPWILVNFWAWAARGDAELIPFLNYPYERYLLPVRFSVASWDNLYIFPLAYFILLLHRFYNAEKGQRSLHQYSLMAILLLLALTYMGQAPHYWIWFIPFMALAFTAGARIWPLHIAQIAALFAYGMIGSRATGGYLFASISPNFFWSLPSPIEWLARFAPPELVIGMAHTAFTAITLWMVFLVYRQLRVRFIENGGA